MYAGKSDRNLALAVDIGGTKVAVGIVDSAGRILKSTRTHMIARQSADDGLKAVFGAVDSIISGPERKRIGGIGVSAPGWVDSNRGVVMPPQTFLVGRTFHLFAKCAPIQASHKNCE